MNTIGNFLLFVVWVGGLGGGSVFAVAITIVIRGRRQEGAAQELLRQSTAAVHAAHRDHRIVREAIDEVDREDVKAAIRRARVDVS